MLSPPSKKSCIKPCVLYGITLLYPHNFGRDPGPDTNTVYHKSEHQDICVLLHDWEGNTGKYSVLDLGIVPPFGRADTVDLKQNISPYCPTRGL